MHLSLVAGPLRLLDADFPDRALMTGIAEHNLRAALAFAARDDRRHCCARQGAPAAFDSLPGLRRRDGEQPGAASGEIVIACSQARPSR